MNKIGHKESNILSQECVDFYKTHFNKGMLLSPSGLFVIQPNGGNGLTKKNPGTLSSINDSESLEAVNLFTKLCDIWMQNNYTTFKKQIKNIITKDQLFNKLNIDTQDYLREIIQTRVKYLEEKKYENSILEIKSDFPEIKLDLMDKKIDIKNKIFAILSTNNIDTYSYEEIQAAKEELINRINQGGMMSLPELEQLHLAACLGNLQEDIVQKIALRFIVESFGDTNKYAHKRRDLIQLHGISIESFLSSTKHKQKNYIKNLSICSDLISAFSKEQRHNNGQGKILLKEIFRHFYRKNNFKICKTLISEFDIETIDTKILDVKDEIYIKLVGNNSSGNSNKNKDGIKPILVGLLHQGEFNQVRQYIKDHKEQVENNKLIQTILEYQRGIGEYNYNDEINTEKILGTIDMVCVIGKSLGSSIFGTIIKSTCKLIGKIIGNSKSLSLENFDLLSKIIKSFKNIHKESIIDQELENIIGRKKYLLFFSVYQVVSNSRSEDYEQKKFEVFMSSTLTGRKYFNENEIIKIIETYYFNNKIELEASQDIVTKYLNAYINSDNRHTKMLMTKSIRHLIRHDQSTQIASKLLEYYTYNLLENDKKVINSCDRLILFLEEKNTNGFEKKLLKIIDRITLLSKPDTYQFLQKLQNPSKYSISYINSFINSTKGTEYVLFKDSFRKLINSQDQEHTNHNKIAYHFIQIAVKANDYDTAQSILKDFPECGETLNNLEDKQTDHYIKSSKLQNIFRSKELLQRVENNETLKKALSQKISDYLDILNDRHIVNDDNLTQVLQIIETPWLTKAVKNNIQKILKFLINVTHSSGRHIVHSEKIYEFVTKHGTNSGQKCKIELWYAGLIYDVIEQIDFLSNIYQSGRYKNKLAQNEREGAVYQCGKNLQSFKQIEEPWIDHFKILEKNIKSTNVKLQTTRLIQDLYTKIITNNLIDVHSAIGLYNSGTEIPTSRLFYTQKENGIKSAPKDLGSCDIDEFHKFLISEYQKSIGYGCKDSFVSRNLTIWKQYLIKLGNDEYFDYFEKEFGLNIRPKGEKIGLSYEQEKNKLDDKYGLMQLQSTSSIYLALMLVTPEHFSDEYIKNILILYQNKGDVGFGRILTENEKSTSNDIKELENIVIKFIKISGNELTQLQKDKAKNILKMIAYHDLGKVTYDGIVSYFGEKIKGGKNVSGLYTLYQELLNEQIQINKFQPQNISTELFMYQKEFIYKFCEGKSNILNADPQGLGKTVQGLGVAETLFERGEIQKCLIVAPNKPKEQWIQEMSFHIRDTPKYHVVGPKTTIADLKSAKYILLNYEKLSGKTLSDKLIDYLKSEVGLLILDEAHGIDNHSTKMHQGVKKVMSKKMRVLPLTASIVQDKRYRLNNLASLFGRKIPSNLVLPKNPKDLVKLIKTEPEKLRLFRDYIFNNYIFIRDKDLIFKRGETLPHKEFFTIEYDLTKEQSRLYEMVLHDFQTFINQYGKKDKTDEGKSTKNNLTAFSQFYYLRRIETMPEMFGLEQNNLLDKLENIVDLNMKNKEKTIIFVAHTNILEKLYSQFEKYNIVRIDGHTNGYTTQKYKFGAKGGLVPDENGEYIHQSEFNRIQFNTSDNHNLIIVNMKSGSKGLNLSNAKHNIILEPTLKFDEYDQAINRHDRINTPHKNISVVKFVSKHPAGLTTISEYISGLLFIKQGFDILMKKGALTSSDLAKITNTSLEGFLKDNNVEKVEGISKDLIREITQILETHFGIPNGNISGLIKCIEQIKSQNKKLDFIHLISAYRNCNFNKFVSRFLSGKMDEYSIEILNSTRLDPNKNLGYTIMDKIIDQYDIEDKVDIISLKDIYMRVPVYIIRTVLKSGLALSTAKIILNKSNTTNIRNKIFELSGIFGPKKNGQYTVFDSLSKFDSELEKMSYADIIKLLKQIQLIGTNDIFSKHIKSVSSIESLQNQINGAITTSFPRKYGVETEELLFHLDEVMQVLEFTQTYDASGLYREQDHIFEGFKHHIKQEFIDYKFSKNNPQDMLLENRGNNFKNIWQNNYSKKLDTIVLDKNSLYSSISYVGGMLQDLISKRSLHHIYGEQFADSLLQNLSDKGINKTLDILYREKNIRGKSYFMYQHLNKIESKDEFEEKQRLIQRAINFVTLFQLLSTIYTEKNQNSIVTKLNAAISHIKIIFEDLKKSEKTGEYTYYYYALDNIISILSGSINKETYHDITISESSNFIDLLSIGTMIHGKKNCFSPHASTKQNRTVADKITNRYKKMIKISSKDGIILTSTLHIRYDDSTKPYLLLDIPFHKGSYNFKKELIDFCLEKISQFKSQGCEIELVVGNDFITKTEKSEHHTSEIITHSPVGKDTHEYIDAIFAVRETGKNAIPLTIIKQPLSNKSASHKFNYENFISDYQVVEKKDKIGIVTIGTSNKSIELYIEQLQKNGIKTVIDIRSKPISQYYPHFNKKAFSEKLTSQGINYIHAPYAGGLQEIDGISYTDFREFMIAEPQKWKEIQNMLIQEIQSHPKGTVALTCAEGNPDECHRKWLIEQNNNPGIVGEINRDNIIISANHL